MPTLPGPPADTGRARLTWTRACGLFVVLVLLAIVYHQRTVNMGLVAHNIELVEQTHLLKRIDRLRIRHKAETTRLVDNTVRLSQQLVTGIFGKLGLDPTVVPGPPVHDEMVRLESNPPPHGGIGGGP